MACNIIPCILRQSAGFIICVCAYAYRYVTSWKGVHVVSGSMLLYVLSHYTCMSVKHLQYFLRYSTCNITCPFITTQK